MSSGNFTFPEWSQLNFTRNCTIAAQFLRSWVDGYQHGYLGAEVNIIKFYFLSALSNSTNSTQPTAGQIVDWYFASMKDWENFQQNVLLVPTKICKAEFCSALTFTGNPDIGGVGMVIAYAMEAGLATAYLFAYFLSKHSGILRRLPRRASNFQAKNIGSRVLAAFEGTVGVFFENATFFSFSMLLASILFAIGNLRKYAFFVSKHSVILAGLMSTFSASVVLLLWPLQHRIVRRKKLHQWMGFLLYVIVLAEVILTGEADNKDQWEIFCYDSATGSGYDKAKRAVVITPGICFVLGVLILLSDHFLSRLEIYRNWKVPDLPFNLEPKHVVMTYAFISMWTLFGAFVDVRRRIKLAAGDSYQENHWGFGQILAMATWAPVLIDLTYIYIFGLKQGLEGRIPRPWSVEKGDTDALLTDESAQPLQPLSSGRQSPNPSNMESSVNDRASSRYD